MAKAKKKTSGDAVGTQPARPQSASVREDPKQARRDLDDALRAAQAKDADYALRRAMAWLAAISELETLLGSNEWLEGRESLAEVVDSIHRRVSLRSTLDDAANQMAREDPFAPEQILAVRLTIFGQRPLGMGRFEMAYNLGATIKALRVLLEADRKLAQPDSSEPQDPLTPEQSGYLKLLHEQDEGEAISDEIAAKRIGYSDPSSIVDLRKVLREKGWNAIATKTGRGGGSSLDRSLLTPVQRDRLDAL
jgi:hypothetical protein